MTGAGAFVTQLRAAFAEELRAEERLSRVGVQAAFERAACGILGRMVDGGAAAELPVTRKQRRRRANGQEAAAGAATQAAAQG